MHPNLAIILWQFNCGKKYFYRIDPRSGLGRVEVGYQFCKPISKLAISLCDAEILRLDWTSSDLEKRAKGNIYPLLSTTYSELSTLLLD